MSLPIAINNGKVVPLEFSSDKVELLKNTVCKGSSDDELQLFLHVCNRTGLDPFRNQIYAIKRGNKMTIQTGIDGFRLIAERTGRYSPGKEPCYTYDVQGKLKSATSFIKKQTTDGSWHDISATAFWDEYVQSFNGKPSQFWAKMPHTMLAKVAEALVLRKAFPADFSGLYTTEEMMQAETSEVSPKTESVVIEENISKPDFSEQEILDFIWHNAFVKEKDEVQIFKIFLDEVKNKKNWDNRKTLETFQKHFEHTVKTFNDWLKK